MHAFILHHDDKDVQLFVAGEHCDYDTRLWAQKVFDVPVLDNWWQVALMILVISDHAYHDQ